MCCLIIPFDSALMFSKPAISKNVANCKIFSNYNSKGEYRSCRLTLLLPIYLIPGDILNLILPLKISMLFMFVFLLNLCLWLLRGLILLRHPNRSETSVFTLSIKMQSICTCIQLPYTTSKGYWERVLTRVPNPNYKMSFRYNKCEEGLLFLDSCFDIKYDKHSNEHLHGNCIRAKQALI